MSAMLVEAADARKRILANKPGDARFLRLSHLAGAHNLSKAEPWHDNPGVISTPVLLPTTCGHHNRSNMPTQGIEAKSGQANSPANSQTLRVLVVDDQDIQRLIVRRALEKLGHQVREANSGASALVSLEKEPADMIISDWLMDEMDGLELCRAVRNRANHPYIYFVLMSSRDSRDDLLAGLNAGADDYLAKPLDMDELGVRIRIGQRLITLQASLQDRNDRLDAALALIHQDIEAAGQFQRDLLPREPLQSDRSQYNWMFLPSARVSGDSLNYFRLDANHIGFYNVDVAGHGVASGMVGMLMAQSLDPRSAGCVLKKLNPDQSVQITPVNEAIGALNRQMTAFSLGANYLTCLYGVLDERSGLVRYVRAGHTIPIVVRADGRSDVSHVDGDMPVGLFNNAEFTELSIQLHAGDRLILYSDGITEAAAPDNEQYEIDRFAQLLSRTIGQPTDDVMSQLRDELQQWAGVSDPVFSDDLSILIVEYANHPVNVETSPLAQRCSEK
ncbi:MAG: SpoIIE family protein phosphatase [Burkholderiaceae bacterium]